MESWEVRGWLEYVEQMRQKHRQLILDAGFTAEQVGIVLQAISEIKSLMSFEEKLNVIVNFSKAVGLL